MHGSNRLFLAALAGLAALSITFGIGVMTGSSYPEEQRYQPYRYAADEPAQMEPTTTAQPNAKTLEYRTPCSQPKGNVESDLCAQWHAANAAEDSAFWAKWGFWVTATGAVGLLVTIVQGRLALDRAQEANEISRDAASAQLRPWMVVKNANYGISDSTVIGGILHKKCLNFSMSWKNAGSSPAIKVNVFSSFMIIAPDAPFPAFHFNEKNGGATIGADVEFTGIGLAIGSIDTARWLKREVDVIFYNRAFYYESLPPIKKRWTEATMLLRFDGFEIDDKGAKRVRSSVIPIGPQNHME